MKFTPIMMLSVAILAFITCSEALFAAEKTIQLTGDNTTISFVGSHVVEKKPDPEARQGEFKDLSGTATIENGQLQAVSVTINMSSVATGNGKLDAHLKSPDFFSVRQYPKAKFVSKTIEAAEAGKVTITGEFTLLKETKAISFPATVSTTSGLSLEANFILDRSQFGMNYALDKIDKEVEMSIKIK